MVYEGITYVVPCGGKKLDRAAPAAQLYVGGLFADTYGTAVAAAESDVTEGRAPAARVLILSAKHGLIDPATVLEPYDLVMGAPGSVAPGTIAVQAAELGIGWDERTCRGSEVYALMGGKYLARLDTALRILDVYVQDSYEGCVPDGAHPGLGWYRRVNAGIRRGIVWDDGSRLLDGPGPIVWLGADVQAFWWGIPILVSYDRLRDAKALPVASAPWVIDSRGFAEIRDHGEWTITAEQYAADLRRYAAQIGRLRWAAPQDWPAGAKMLIRTGLSEEEHQRRTIASVLELRAMGLGIPIICVVTGRDLAGYLRHIDMYRQAGIDLLAEQLPIGVGALVGRTPTEAAAIIRALHTAGLRRMHGFGVKGVVLDLCGWLLDSIDSAEWSGEARRRAGRCEHGGSVEWETNCPQFAAAWGEQQRARAVAAQQRAALPAARRGHDVWQPNQLELDLFA